MVDWEVRLRDVGGIDMLGVESTFDMLVGMELELERNTL
jgi:hypothetical protein